MANTDDTNQSIALTSTPSLVWRPSRPLLPVDTSGDQIQRLQRQFADLNTTVDTQTAAAVAVSTAAPSHVTGVMASVLPYKTATGLLKSVVAVSFTPGRNFARASVWFSNYNGNSQPQLMAQGLSSPVEFLCETTGELATVTVVAANSAGVSANFSTAPTTTVALSTSGTRPPAPTLNQPLVAIGGGIGWQFGWNAENGLLEDVIDGYWIYRSTSSTSPTPPANRLTYIKQPASNIGVLTFQDIIAGAQYYWISAVSLTGLESLLTSAGSGSPILTDSEYPSSSSGAFSDPTQAYDGNETSAAAGSALPAGTAGATDSQQEVWAGFTNHSGTITGLTLNVLSAASANVDGEAKLEYSLDGGSTWVTLYDWALSYDASNPFSSDSLPKQYFNAALSTTQDLTLLQIRATVTATSHAYSYWDPGIGSVVHGVVQGYASQTIYEARVTVTYF